MRRVNQLPITKFKANSQFTNKLKKTVEGKTTKLGEVTNFLKKCNFAFQKDSFEEIVDYLNKIQEENGTKFKHMPTLDWLSLYQERCPQFNAFKKAKKQSDYDNNKQSDN